MINITIDGKGAPSINTITIGNEHENRDEVIQFTFQSDLEPLNKYAIAKTFRTDKRESVTLVIPLVNDSLTIGQSITNVTGTWALYVMCKSTNGERVSISDPIVAVVNSNNIDMDIVGKTEIEPNIKIIYDELMDFKKELEQNEATRQANESDRVTAESERVTAETARTNEEHTRQENEAQRAENEANRAHAEEARASAETERISNEDTRKTNEALRVNAEGTRTSAENERIKNESERVSAESNRSQSESVREKAEATRLDNEEKRAEAEKTRLESEQERINAEAEREQNEQSRVNAESQRVNAETERVSAETARAEAEATRATNEQTRINNETSRVSAESERVTAETARQEAENKRDDIINDLRESVDRKITKFYASNQGETHITDSDNGKIQDMLIYGKSEQFTTTGKNLLKIKDGEQTTRGVTVTAKNGVIQLKGTATETGYAILEIDPITLSGTYITSNNYSDTIKVTLANASYQSVLEQNRPNVLEDEEITKICFTVSSGKSYDISNILIQLEKSSSATAYEPYTGGIPSPSPNYPQDIKSVVNPTIKLIGANLLKLEFEVNENNGITLEVVGNKLRFHGTITDTYTFFRLKNKPLIKKGTKVSLYADNHDGHTAFMRLEKTSDGTFDSLNKDNPSDTLSEDKYLNAIGIGRYNVGDTIDFTTTFAVLDSTDIYKPYMEQSITLPITLNAVPVPSGGNVTIDGKQYIADYIDVESGKIVRRTKRVDLKDVSVQTNLSYGTNANGIGYLAYFVGNSSNEMAIKDTAPLSNKYIGSRWTNESGYAYITSGRSIIFVDSRFVDKQTAISLIKDVYVIYATNTSNEEDLTVEQIKALKAFKTYYPTTNIRTNSEQLEGYTTFNYSISLANGWNYVKQQLNDNRDYIYDVDMQSSEAYVNSEYVTALTELGV